MAGKPRVIGHRADGRPIYEIKGAAPEELVTVPTDLTLLSDADLAELEGRAVQEFDRLQGDENVKPETLEYQIRLTNDIDRMRAERAGRDARARDEANRLQADMLRQRETLESRVHGARTGEGDQGGDGGTVNNGNIDTAAIARAAAEGATAALVAAIGQRRMDVTAVTQRATATLADARRHAPAITTAPRRLAITAGVDIPGVARGAELASLDELVGAFHRAAKGMPATRDGSGQERLVASIRNEYEHVVDDRTTPAQVQELIDYLTSDDKKDALVAGGGWCAPSEIRYEFFNVAGVDGLIDLPTVGITRGGIRWPTSPSIADAFGANGLGGFAVAFSNTSVPWLWTETDDILTVTGSTNKPTLRVPCPSFNEARLECYGVTLTAGNLTDDAYPEATQNTLRLLTAAHQHAINGRIIANMVTLSGTAITGVGSANAPVFQTVFDGLEMAATDYKAKYAMTDDSVLEVVLPFWLRKLIRADLAWRLHGDMDMLSVADGVIDGFFADRRLRPQWVNDWQVRGANQFGNASTNKVAWPTSASVMLYAAGTFVKGNGLTLDLGVVRDSVLNAENDFTAAWTEECHLVARVGNESRLYTLTFAVDGATTAGITAAAQV